MSAQSIGYIQLLRENTPFRRLWYGQVVSQLGDWFDTIALYALLPRLTGSEQSVGLLLLAQFIPPALVGPWAGVIVDRLPRKLTMIATDLARALLVLLLLLVRDASMVWLIYLVVALRFTLSAFFEPARTAIIPAVTKREQLIAANAIGGATWSAMLAIGAALGGLVAGVFGTDAAFIINALSFLLSGALIWSVRVSETHLDGAPAAGQMQDLREGLRYLAQHRVILIYTLTKALWSISGGILIVLTLFGRTVFPLGVDGALSIGLMYAARGVGAGIGPLVANQLGGSSTQFLRRMIGPAFLISALGYALMSGAPALWLAALAAVVAHVGGSIQWVYSSALLQMEVPDRLQGRVFAIELALLTLSTGVSSYLTSLLADAGWTPPNLALLMAALFVPAGLWLTWRLR
ncbi:MAG: MFS transporter [Roseiflexaceae bacterium]|nr:MFS transporter [Roseiflexaceae bacterium]